KANRKTTRAYRPAVARSGKTAIRAPMARRPIMLWRRRSHMADVDRFASFDIPHFPPAESRGSHRADLAVMAHRDFIARPNLAGGIHRADREDIPRGQEVLNLDPVRVGPREDFAAVEGQRKKATVRVHGQLSSTAKDAHVRETPAKRRVLEEREAGFSELEASDVRHLLDESHTSSHRLRGTRDLVQRPSQGHEGVLGGRM